MKIVIQYWLNNSKNLTKIVFCELWAQWRKHQQNKAKFSVLCTKWIKIKIIRDCHWIINNGFWQSTIILTEVPVKINNWGNETEMLKMIREKLLKTDKVGII